MLAHELIQIVLSVHATGHFTIIYAIIWCSINILIKSLKSIVQLLAVEKSTSTSQNFFQRNLFKCCSNFIRRSYSSWCGKWHYALYFRLYLSVLSTLLHLRKNSKYHAKTVIPSKYICYQRILHNWLDQITV